MWCELGLVPDDFWSKTPREVARICAGIARRFAREQDQAAWLAWHVAALMRSQKFPKLETMLVASLKKSTKPMSADHQWAMMTGMRH